MDEIIDFVKDKNILVVGPSSHIQKMKETIDSFDVVIRLNFGYPIQKKLQKDFGTRTDVCFSVAGIATNLINSNTYLNQPIKYIALDSNKKNVSHQNNIKITSKWCEENNIKNIIWDWEILTNKNNLLDVYNYFKLYPTTGIHILNFLINSTKPKSISVMGYSFNLFDHFQNYPVLFGSNTYPIAKNRNMFICKPNSLQIRKTMNKFFKYCDEKTLEKSYHFALLDFIYLKKIQQERKIIIHDEIMNDILKFNTNKIIKNSPLNIFQDKLIF